MAGWRLLWRSYSDRSGTKGGALSGVAMLMMPPLGSSRSVVCGARRRPPSPGATKADSEVRSGLEIKPQNRFGASPYKYGF
jgi:hypothetical protein